MDWKNDEVLKALIEKAKQTGTLTYDEVTAALPPDADPDRLSELTDYLLDQTGVSLIDGDEEAEEAPVAATAEVALADPEASTYEDSDGDGRHIDDPVRMYLPDPDGPDRAAQPEAGGLARHEARTHPPPLPPQGAGVRLRDAAGGRDAQARPYRRPADLDRTIKVSQTENLEKDKILQRMPHNLRTLEPLMEYNVEDFQRLSDERTAREGEGRHPRTPPAPPPQDGHAR